MRERAAAETTMTMAGVKSGDASTPPANNGSIPGAAEPTAYSMNTP